ncbi:TIR domain-containing protein [Candidatus Poribacteria bacterium]|nr:TIR domain-containing protein [Candidatus Poribacteria bacterium]
MRATVQIFLSYAREDKEKVESLYQKLSDAGFKPWMDTKDLLPGEKWRSRIQKAIRDTDFFLACLTANSITKRGFLQREIKLAWDILQEQLESDIYLIPVRLEVCDVPEILCEVQWVDVFEDNGWARLLEAIHDGIARRTDVQKSSSSDPNLLPETKPPEAGSEQPPTHLPTILIVEDNSHHSRLIRDHLQDNGYSTLEATNLRDALHKIQTFQGSLIVLIDIAIPEESGGMVLRRGGINLLEKLREFNSEIPAIFVTVYGEAKDVIEIAKRYKIPVVSKPLDIDQLLREVRNAS